MLALSKTLRHSAVARLRPDYNLSPAENSSSAVRISIDFAGLQGAIKVRNGALLAFAGVSLTNAAYKPWTASNDTYLIDAALAGLPSILTEPNATVSMCSIQCELHSLQT